MKKDGKRQIHWRQPSVMFVSLLAAAGAAGGHHAFYLYLDTRSVEDNIPQQWTFRIGTGLAFLVRVLLSLSLGVAILQCFWNSLEANKRPATLKDVDRVYSVTSDIFVFFCPRVWAFNPTMMLLGLIFWYDAYAILS